MTDGLAELRKREYPGRGIILGSTIDGNDGVCVYFVTGRSGSSKARRLVHDEKNGVVHVEATDPKLVEKGSRVLLEYPAIAIVESNLVVSNGAQTNVLADLVREEGDIEEYLCRRDSCIYDSKLGWIDLASYEPDKPIFTSRIVGHMDLKYRYWRGTNLGSDFRFQLGTFFRGKDASKFGNKAPQSLVCKHDIYAFQSFHPEVQIQPGEGKMITTYDGDRNDLRHPRQMPLDVMIETQTAEDTANAVWEALTPDLRVGVAAVHMNMKTLESRFWIINGCE
jgi:IMP cyclohydrolase